MKKMTRNAMTGNNVNDTVRRPRLLWNGDGYDSRRMTDAELRDWSIAVDSLDTWYREHQLLAAAREVQDVVIAAAAVLAECDVESSA